jgi:lysyl-tRNA synthetase, class II
LIESQEIDQIQQRRRHLEEIAEMGHDIYPNRFDRTHAISQIVERYQSYAGKKADEAEAARVNEDLKAAEGGEVRIAGRLITTRSAFALLSDGLRLLQVYVSKKEVGEEDWKLYQKLDLGDWIGVTGYLFVTRMGSLAVHATRLRFLAKAMLPMPDKFHGVADKELRYRQRYVDLIASGAAELNREKLQSGELTSREVFERRAQIVREIRHYFDERGYVEVETPRRGRSSRITTRSTSIFTRESRPSFI